MAWSIFSDGGGDGAALTWAKNLLQADGAPDTPGNEQFVYDWEKSEGGGGKYNPLNQGPVPGHPELTTTGQQFGGGAADFASYSAGIQGAVDYLNMPNYTAVQAALKANDPTQARAALIASPWAASHYGGGSAFSNAALPGQATSLLGDSTNANAASATTGSVQSANWISDFFGGADVNKVKNWLSGLGSGSTTVGLQKLVERGALIVFGAVIVLIGIVRLSGGTGSVTNVVMGPVGAASKTVKKAERKQDRKDREVVSSASDDEG